MNKIVWSKKSDNWSTPISFLTEWCTGEWFDPCPLYPKVNGLAIPWKEKTFVNPPYSKIKFWLEKAKNELQLGNCKKIVLLLPARTDTKWFHDYIYDQHDIYFLKGRLKFGGSKNSAPFPSMVVIMHTNDYYY